MTSLCALIPSLALVLVTGFAACKDRKPGIAPTARPAATRPAPVAPQERLAAEPERSTLVRAQPLPQVALASLRHRMQNHGDDTENLLWAALMLDYDSTDGVAKLISEEPTLARPLDGDRTTINAMLPPEFFDLQDELGTALQRLRTAARAKDDAKLARGYGEVVRTCISCHSLFLQFPAPE